MPIDVINPYHPDIPITFRQLLSHVSSLRDNWDVMYSTYVIGDSPYQLEDYVAMYFLPGGDFYSTALNFFTWPPANYWTYCNHNFVLVGYLVQTISGVSFSQYCHDSIFTPLGMDETSWFLSELNLYNVAMPYHYDGQDYEALGHFSYADYPAGALFTSAPQLARYLMTFINNGAYKGTRIFNGTTVDSMMTQHFPNLYSNIGLVWFRGSHDGYYTWEHGGGDQGVSTMYGFCPSKKTGAVVLTNGEARSATNAIYHQLLDFAANIEYDYDGDGIDDNLDNCPEIPNIEQADSDNDNVGDDCDNCLDVQNTDQTNSDNDAYGDLCDNCDLAENPLQEDTDYDSIGDACDNCPDIQNTDQVNNDNDLFGDLCDNCDLIDNPQQEDTDNDSVGDLCDNCPEDSNPDQADDDSDNIGNACDFVCGDADNDQLVNIKDITYLIKYKYKNGLPPVDFNAGDVDSSGDINIQDITYLIKYKYKSGPEPVCIY
jgi:hypothetical protein